MILPIVLLIAQTMPPPDPSPTRRVGVDLPRVWHPAGTCSSEPSDDDIVVCGKPDAGEQYRVRPLPEKYAEVGGPGLGLDLGKGTRGNLYTDSGTTIDGKVSKRIMVKVTKSF